MSSRAHSLLCLYLHLCRREGWGRVLANDPTSILCKHTCIGQPGDATLSFCFHLISCDVWWNAAETNPFMDHFICLFVCLYPTPSVWHNVVQNFRFTSSSQFSSSPPSSRAPCGGRRFDLTVQTVHSLSRNAPIVQVCLSGIWIEALFCGWPGAPRSSGQS